MRTGPVLLWKHVKRDEEAALQYVACLSRRLRR